MERVYDKAGLKSEVWQVSYGLQKTFRGASRRQTLKNEEDRMVRMLTQTTFVESEAFQAEARKQLEAIDYESGSDGDGH